MKEEQKLRLWIALAFGLMPILVTDYITAIQRDGIFDKIMRIASPIGIVALLISAIHLIKIRRGIKYANQNEKTPEQKPL